MEQIKPNFLHFKLDKKNIIKELNSEEINIIKEKHKLSLFFRFKRKVKFCLNFVKNLIFLSKNQPFIKSRTLDNVKKKYDNISGKYIEKYLDKKSSFIAEIDEDKKVVELKGTYERYYSDFLLNLTKKIKFNSILEVGAGELTLIAELLNKLKKKENFKKAALDISYHRLNKGQNFLKKKKINLHHIIKGDAANQPFADNSFDIVYTSHCLEQVPHLFNKIVNECVRVSKKYVIFIEPSYEFGSDVTKNHIYKKGYPIIKKKLFSERNYKIIYRNSSPVKSYTNGTEIIILKKNRDKKTITKSLFICPSCRRSLKINNHNLICENENLLFKIRNKIPLLEVQDGSKRNEK
tara:strand:+ start:738 stop:1787 length:1050 start_codon:yes stop_codon:yes gene_type:complete